MPFLGLVQLLVIKTADLANTALYVTFSTVGFLLVLFVMLLVSKCRWCLVGLGMLFMPARCCHSIIMKIKDLLYLLVHFRVLCLSFMGSSRNHYNVISTEQTKGRAIMVFWVIFNLGAVIGSIIPLAENMHNQGSSASDGTFIAFIILMICGSVLANFMLPISKVWKSDGTRVMTKTHPYWKDELIGLGRTLIKEPKILLMFPMFFASNWFYTYQFNNVNYGRFNLRTRSLNSLLYWLAQMFGAIVLGYILDFKKFERSTRAKIGWAILFVTSLAIWGGGLKFQMSFTREEVESKPPKISQLDFKDGAYIGPMFLYIFYGVFDAIFQTYTIWVLGAMSNNPKKTALTLGFTKVFNLLGLLLLGDWILLKLNI